MPKKEKKEVMQLVKAVEEKKKKKKKKSTFKKMLKGGLKIAGDVAPIALPLALSLLANHGNNPGVVGSRNIRALQGAAPSASMVPLNGGVPSNFCSPGMFSMSERKDSTGKVVSIVATGREAIGNLTVPDGAAPGDVVFDMQLQPLSGLLIGTRLSNLAASYARFRVLGCSLVVVSSLAATQAGQLVAAILTDPQQEIPATGGGEAVIRVLSDSAGSDVFQVWSSGIALYPGSVNVDPFYTNPLSSDEYLTSGGQAVVATMTANASGSDLQVGEVFLDYSFELLQPTLEVYATIVKGASIQGGSGASACTDAAPLGLADPPTVSADSIGVEALDGTGFTLPPGKWWLVWYITTATAVTSAITAGIAAVDAAALAVGGSANLVMGTPNALASTAFNILFEVDIPSPCQIPFGSFLTGITGDTVQSNQVYIFNDPFEFPQLGNSKRLAQVNRSARDSCQSALALMREKELAARLARLESHARQTSGGVTGFGPFC